MSETSLHKPRLLLGGIGSGSRIFAQRLGNARLFKPDLRGVPLVADNVVGLTISFAGVKPTDKLRIEDIATLALVIRSIAAAQRTVTIELPPAYRGNPSRIYRFLARLGFWDLFVRRETDHEWCSNVVLVGDNQHYSGSDIDDTNAHYIPLRWFTKQEFATAPDVGNIWHVRPTIAPEVDRQFRSLLQTRGLADAETTDLLGKTMFVELGWNVILHSGITPGDAVGAFCGQIDYWHDDQKRRLPQTLTFCIADIGCGIPNALRTVYQAEADLSRRYHLIEGCTENTAILRYALDPDSTSRPDLPSHLDRAGFRGLAFVAAALHGTGDMSIRSGII